MENQNNTPKYEIISTSHRGIVYEQRKNFSGSVFEKVYKRAYVQVQDSVCFQLERESGRGFQEDSDNLIAFIGRRGTGKSSAMLSFMNALCENITDIEDSNYTVYENRRNRKKVKFIKIEWIDASMLEKGEDIFELILAKMFNEFLKEIENNTSESLTYKKRELHNKFASIYKKHLNIKSSNNVEIYSSESAISSLRNLARSVDIKQEFQDLVYRYIQIQEEKEQNIYETFLVVAIDDLDMNVEFGFEILEKIQRYLKIDRLMVLLAINYEQMKMCCQKHFSKAYEEYSHILPNESKEYIKTKINNLAEQYMEKSLPSYARIYLPSLKKKDYDRSSITKIKIINKGKTEYYSIKQAIFILTAKKTMVRYDVAGKKRHFMEPESLRKLNDFWIFRENMEDLPNQNEEEFLEILDFNYRRSMDDLLFRYADETLSEKESKFFLTLSETDIRSRGELIVLDFLKRISKKSTEEINFIIVNDEKYYHLFERDFFDFKYSYGELLRSLYFMGREEVAEKNLVRAILAMYSLVFTRIFYRYKLGKSSMKKNNYEMIKNLIGGSVAGSWSRYAMPGLDKTVTQTGKESQQKIFFAGSAKDIELAKKMSDGLVSISLHVYNESIIKKDKTDWNDDQYMDYFVEICNSLHKQFVLLLFLNMKEKYTLQYIEASQEEKKLTGKAYTLVRVEPSFIQFTSGKADYNILNFINNTFIYKENLIDFVTAICSLVSERSGRNLVIDDNLVEGVIEKLNAIKGSFFANMKDWEEKCGGALVPFYSVDIFYNMLKRIVRKQSFHQKGIIYEEELYEYMVELLTSIGLALNENDQWYGYDSEEYLDYVEGFADNFYSCPVVKVLYGKENNNSVCNEADDIKPLFNNFITQLVDGENNHKYPQSSILEVLLAD